MAPEISLDFPFAGRSDSQAFSKQSALSCREAQNVRGRDPFTGRIRGAQRAGLTRHNTNQATGKWKELCNVVGDNRKITYAQVASGSEVLGFSSTNPSMNDSLSVATDSLSNLYVLDSAAGITKYNSAGVQLFRIPLPLPQPGMSVRALYVDPTFLTIYAGVSAGGDQSEAAMWAYKQLNDNDFEQLWEVKPGAYIEELERFGGKLYTVQNSDDRIESHLRIYDLAPAVPRLDVDQLIPWPVNDLSVGDDGAAHTAHPESTLFSTPNTFRRGSRQDQGSTPRVVDWTPLDLSDHQARIWSWYSADDVSAVDVEGGELVEGAEVLIWRDKTGNGRHLLKNLTEASQVGPAFTFNAPNGNRGLRFNGTDTSLISGVNVSTRTSEADQQRTMLPCYEGAMFLVIVVFRYEPSSTLQQSVFYQGNDAAGASDHALCVNRACGAALPGVAQINEVSYFAATDNVDTGACAAADQFSDVTLINTSVNIVSVLWDGQVDGGNPGAGFTRSLFRSNGGPQDRCEGLPLESIQATRVGSDPNGALNHLNGTIHEIIVLERINRTDDSTEPKVLTHEIFPDIATVAQTDNELTRLEGYEVWKWRDFRNLPIRTSGTFGHPFGEEQTGLLFGPPPDAEAGFYGELATSYPLQCKWDSNGRLAWCYNANRGGEVDADTGGVGLGCKVDTVTGEVYAVGHNATTAAGPAPSFPGTMAARKIIDQGDLFSVAQGDGAWRAAFGDWAYEYPKIDVDEFGSVYIAVDDAAVSTTHVRVYQKAPDGGGLGVLLLSRTLPNNVEGRAIVSDPDVPTYSPDAILVAEHFFVASANGGTATDETIFKYGMLSITHQTGSIRTMRHLGVQNDGTIVRWVEGSSAFVTPTGGSAALDGATEYVQCAVVFASDAVFVDGLSVPKIYAFDDDTVSDLESNTSGEVPKRPKLAEFWRSRLLFARLADDPTIIRGSALGDVRDWDFDPPDPLSTSAFRMNLARAGRPADIVNAIVPWTDDVLAIGGDHSLWLVTGDPRDGGQRHLITESYGMAFGRPYCKDRRGRLFFFASPPALYGWAPGSLPEPLSLNTLDDTDFENEIDFGMTYIRLIWNDVAKGIHILQFPFGAGGVPHRHWFWEEKTHHLVERPPIWPDSFSSVDVQPTAVTVIDGDSPGDRIIVFGCEDGFLRRIDPTARGDDQVAIDSFVLHGPLRQTTGDRIALRRFTAELASDQDGCRWEYFASDQVDTKGEIKESGNLVPGRNRTISKRVSGDNVFIRLRNAQLAERWAVESMTIDLVSSGRKQRRLAR